MIDGASPNKAKEQPARRWRALPGLALVVSLLLGSGVAWARETIELIPDDRAGWGATNVFAPVTGFFLGGPGYWYSAREIEVETTPPGAVLDLFYVRANFQKRYDQAESPVLLKLPSRIEAGPRDSVTIRALLDGYKQGEVTVRVRSRAQKISIDLEPLPNLLDAMSHAYFSGRGTLSFLTQEAVSFRVQRASDGFSIVLTQTGQTPAAAETMEGIASANIKSLQGHQLGEDLVVRVRLHEGEARKVELRQRQSYDAVRGLHAFSVDLVPEDGGASAVNNALSALSRVEPDSVRGCALEFDRSLREQLEPAALSRALTPSGTFLDPYLRSALKRLGELAPDGVLNLADGSSYRAAVPIELAAAQSQSAVVIGYLALLAEFVAQLEAEPYRRNTLRGLIAPEVASAAFAAMLDSAEAEERSCRGTAATADAPNAEAASPAL